MYWLTGILGILLLFAPFLFGYETNTAALWTSLGVGVVVAGASWFEGLKQDKENWEYWVAEVVAIFAILSPYIFGFTTHEIAYWSTISIGVLIAAVSGMRLLTGSMP